MTPEIHIGEALKEFFNTIRRKLLVTIGRYAAI
jgi:hypothetical protein